MHELAPLIKDLAIMLGIASIVVLVFQKIRQPVVLGYILAGIIIGPYTPPYSLVTDIAQIKTLSELGVIFLMFALGLDFSFHRLKKIGFSSLVTGIIKVAAMIALGFWIGRFLHWGFYDCVFLGIALAISSTMIIIKALEELNLKGKRFAGIVFGVLIAEDLLAILMLTTLTTVGVTKNLFSFDMIFAVMKLVFVIGTWFLSGYFIVPILFRRIIKYISQETLTIVSVALCLILSVIAVHFHYSAALGAFIMGSILAETPLVARIRKLTIPLRDVFAAVFFISIGMLIDLKILLEQWPIILMISVFTIVSKILVTSIGTFLAGQGGNTAVRVGFSMIPIGEFSFIIVSAGATLHMTSSALYQTVVGVAAITILVTPYFIKLSNGIVKKLDQSLSERSKYFLESYSAWVFRALASYKKQTEYRRFILRLLANGVIVLVIFNLTYNFILPQLKYLLANVDIATICSWIIAVLLSLPFIWGMLFSFRLIHRNRQIPPLFLGGTLTIVQIIILSVAYFNTWYIPLVIAGIIVVFFILSYKHLGKAYYWFERYVIYLLRMRRQKQVQYEELAPWDTHLVEVVVNNNDSAASVVGKTLSESKLRQRFSINIVAIRRGSQVILVPRGDEKILLQDRLIVLGNDAQIEAFKKIVETVAFDPEYEDILKDFVLKAAVLEPNNPLIGKSIRDSNIREQIYGFVVGLERNGFRILNPDPGTILRANDLLLVVGKETALFNLRAVGKLS